MKTMALILSLAAVAAVIGLSLAASPGGAQAQGASPAAPANVRAVDGAGIGQAVLLWDAVEDAAYYRIGWVNMETYRAVIAEGGREWLDVFAFYDVVNRRQTAQTITDLAPGVEYAFIMASVDQRFGGAAGWSGWTYLTTTAAASCPTDTGTVPGAPGGGGTPTPTPQPGATPTPTPEPGATPAATATVTPTPTPTPGAGAAASRDYDADDDGLIEITTLAQLHVIRHDLDGDGVAAHADHAAAFPDALDEMGCFDGCLGYELKADLDFDTDGSGGFDAGDVHWNDGAGWQPLGGSDAELRYNAIFDGNDHSIANLLIRRRGEGDDDIGLFRVAGADAHIRNVRLVNVRVAGRDRVGGLVGSSYGRIAGSSVTGRVSGLNQVGGLAGYNSGRVSSSGTTVAVSGMGEKLGGLIGYSVGKVEDSRSGGDVTATGTYGEIGGLVGRSQSSVTGSYANGAVSGRGNWVGGLVGFSDGSTITASYATGNVAGGSRVGGLVGYADGYTRVIGTYAAGTVAGDADQVGGLIGRTYSDVTDSYATGAVTGEGSSVGGLIGSRPGGSVNRSYWNTQTTGQSRGGGGTGKTTKELQSPTGPTGIYGQWNAEWWDFGTSDQYPVLKYRGMDVAAQRQ